MAIERVLATTEAGTLIGGLQWRPIDGKPSSKALSEARKLSSEATHYTLLVADRRASYGLFHLRPSEESEKLPKVMCSAAAVFASLVGDEQPNAALILRLPALSDDKEERIYVVVLDDGVPTVDTVTDNLGARNALGDEVRQVYTNDGVSHPSGEQIDLEWLSGGIDKEYRIIKIPVNPIPIILLTVVVVAIAGGSVGLSQYRKKQQAKLEAAAAIAADPLPKYQTALSMQSRTMSSSRKDFAAMASHIFQQAVVVPGWQLLDVECEALQKACTSHWKRAGGTYQDLKQALPKQRLQYVYGQNGKTPILDAAATVLETPVERVSLIGTHGVLPDQIVLAEKELPVFQVWKTAGIAVDIKDPRPWPVVPGVPEKWRNPQVIHQGSIDVKQLSGAFVMEAINTAPKNFSWERVKATIANSDDPKSRLSFELSGTYYVKQSQQ